MLHFGVIGYPVAHSFSPQVHGAGFQALGIDAISERIEVKPENLANFMAGFREKYAGVNVTIPHKETIMDFLDEIDGEARAIGAVNLVVNRGGKLIGYNVDLYGAMVALAERMAPDIFPKLDKPFLSGKKVTVLGAGGASRAISFGVLKYGGSLTILNRHPERAEILAKDFSGFFPKSEIRTGVIEDFDPQSCDILVQTTPCGMQPNIEETPFPNFAQKISDVAKKPAVMDIVYRPRETRFLREAKEAGCKIITGDRMFLFQAVRGLELWTGKKAPVEAMEKALEGVLD